MRTLPSIVCYLLIRSPYNKVFLRYFLLSRPLPLPSPQRRNLSLPAVSGVTPPFILVFAPGFVSSVSCYRTPSVCKVTTQVPSRSPVALTRVSSSLSVSVVTLCRSRVSELLERSVFLPSKVRRIPSSGSLPKTQPLTVRVRKQNSLGRPTRYLLSCPLTSTPAPRFSIPKSSSLLRFFIIPGPT